jgi:hypothetical protein
MGMSGVVLTVEVAPFRRQDGRIGGRSVGGIEIRPVTGAQVEALAAGRCACGCEGDGPVREARTLDGRLLPAGAPAHVAEMPQDFAANTDGPWPLPWSAFEREIGKLAAADRQRLGLGEVPLSRLSPLHGFVLGVRSAMEWTLGLAAKPPFWPGPPVLVSDAAIGRALYNAGNVAARGRADLFWYAEGAQAWLRWIAGLVPEIVYPPRQ